MKKIYDFSGYATRNDLQCTDGRTIRKDAFIANNGETVPLVWQHKHDDPGNVLGHALLENREDGVYTYAVFNDTPQGRNAKKLVEHGDITNLSIYANQLKQQGSNVIHGAIREVSIVLTGANPGAFIDGLSVQHGDGIYSLDEAIIYNDDELELEHGNAEEEETPMIPETDELEHEDNRTIQDVFDTLTEDQKNVVYAIVAQAIEDEKESVSHSDEGEYDMYNNVFDNSEVRMNTRNTLSHAQIEEIFSDAKEYGSLRDSFMAHAGDYGIDNIDVLFPDAQTIRDNPDFVARDMEWVADVLAGTSHSPFTRIKSVSADITLDTARAKGYVKGNMKKDEFFGLANRVTTPTTIYKKQKLDRDDILDITDLDVVAFLKAEMRVMLNEELARAILIGDGREVDDEDHINATHIRPIVSDEDFYAYKVKLSKAVSTEAFIDSFIRERKNYKGTGTPTLFTTTAILSDMLLLKDTLGRRLYPTVAELAGVIRVAKIVEVPVMENLVNTHDGVDYDVMGIMVYLPDYTVGADKGGDISMFDDFDIDYNQYKYLMETRCSGTLTRPASALVFEKPKSIVVG